MRYDYNTEQKLAAEVVGIPCELFYDRLDRNTIPAGKHYYEIGADDDCGDEPARIKKGILVNFYGSLVCDQPLPLDEDGVLWLDECEYKNL